MFLYEHKHENMNRSSELARQIIKQYGHNSHVSV